MRHSAKIIIAVTFLIAISASSFGYWTPEVRISEYAPCWEPRIVAVGDTLHAVFVNDNGREKIDYLRSTDGGHSWAAYRSISDTVNTVNAYFPRILIYGRKTLVVWYSIFNIGPYDHNLGYSRSTDGGITWATPAYILSRNRLNLNQFAMANHDSLVNLIYGEPTDSGSFFYNVKSTNFGASWQPPIQVFRVGNSSDVDMDAEGDNFYYVWSGALFDTSTYWDIYYKRSSNGGDTWSDFVPISPTDQYVSHAPALSANGQGHLVCSWTDWIHSPNWFTGDIYVKLSSDYGETWSDYRQISYDHLEDFSDIFWETHNIHAVWEKYSYRQMVIYRNSTDDGATWGEETWLDHDTSSSLEPHIVANEDKAYAIWINIDSDTGGLVGTYFTRYLPFMPGDANNSGEVNGLDVSYLVNYLKGFGPPPEQFLSGDANGNCTVNGLDVVYLINYFKSGPEPIEGDCP